MELILFLFENTTFYMSLLQLGIGLLLGIAMGFTGVGGGILIIPLLQSVFMMDPVLAVGTASIIASLVKVNASFFHIKSENVDWHSVKGILIGAIPIGMLSAFAVVSLYSYDEYRQLISNMTQILVIFMMFYALVSLITKCSNRKKSSQISNSNLLKKQKWSFKRAITSGSLCGLVIGTTGIGGGVLLLPILNSYLGINIKKSVGSSIVIALVLSAITSFIYVKGGQSDIPTALMLVLGSLFGVPFATTLVKRTSEATLYLATLCVICISLIIMMFSCFF